MSSGNDHGASQDELEQLAREQYNGTSTRGREHAVVAGRWTVVHRSLAVTAAVLSAVVGGSLLTSRGGAVATVAAVLALIAAVVSATDVALGAATNIVEHKKAADRFTRVASHFALFYRVELRDGSSYGDQRTRYEAIMAERDKALDEAPHLPAWAQRVERERRQTERNSKKKPESEQTTGNQ